MNRQRGHTAVEMALVLGLFIGLIVALVDLARWSLATAALHEGARLGARLAAVCDPYDPTVALRVEQRVAALQGPSGSGSPLGGVMPQVTVAYSPTGCTQANCSTVRVSLEGAAMRGVAPWWPAALALPAATVEIPRESLRSTLDGRNNPQCL